MLKTMISKFVQRFQSKSSLKIDEDNRLKAVLEFNQQLSSKISAGENAILQFIHQKAEQFMDTENMYIAMYDRETNMVRFPVFYKKGKPGVVESRKAGKGRTEEIIRSGEPILIRTHKESQEWYQAPGRSEYISDPLASWIGVPMKREEQVVGVIATYHPEKDDVYDDADLNIMQAMANIACIALENARFQRMIADQEAMMTRMQIAADLAHRLNNMAGSIPVWIDICRERLQIESIKDETLDDALNYIDRDAKNLLQAVEELKIMPEPETVNLVSILQELVQQARIQIPDNINIDLCKIPKKKLLIQAVSSELRNALWSIINNAIEAMPKGGILSIQTASILKENVQQSWAEVNIRDTGQGIAFQDYDKIFNPLYSTKEKNRGFGLWSAKNTIERIKGNIKFESHEGEGTIFVVRIPEIKE